MKNGTTESMAQRREAQPDQTALTRQSFTYDANGTQWLEVSRHEFWSNTIDLRVALFLVNQPA